MQKGKTKRTIHSEKKQLKPGLEKKYERSPGV
jgi:hypothetical protein